MKKHSTKKRFVVEARVHRTSQAVVVVEATSKKEAREKAHEVLLLDLKDADGEYPSFEPCPGATTVVVDAVTKE